MAMASYLSADYRDDVIAEKKAEIGDELDRYAFSVGYRYPLSKSHLTPSQAQKLSYSRDGTFEMRVSSVIPKRKRLCLAQEV